jgi:EAL domain-containing protein (putative c-di-GMP-specific phosphodiesterase class I)/ActR/RegA family two-component response regulator
MGAQYRGRMLILEDDPGVGNVIRMIATACGLESHVVAQPETFFATVDAWQPDYIALDLVMPDMDGVQVLGELGRRLCAADIIITSGMGSRVLDAAGRSAQEHGLKVIGLLAKPFSATALRDLLEPKNPRPRAGVERTPDAVTGAAVTGAAVTDPAVKGPALTGPALTVRNFRAALESKHFRVHYQPKIDCADGGLAGFEALVRWARPNGVLIMPGEFVSFAETHGLINELTDAVLEQALLWFGDWLERHPGESGVSLSINISATSLQDGTLVDRIARYCEQSVIPPERLIFEITETSAMRNPVVALAMLTRMRVKGFQLSIDDFGTGYSSMLQLVRMPFSEVKVDKSFVMSAIESAESRAVIKSIVDLGRSLGLKSAAEGVENAETFDLLRELGCDFAQGYWIARPMSGGDVAAWIAARPSMPVLRGGRVADMLPPHRGR